MAALECNDPETADTGLKNLTAKFGRESSRVQRLEAMRMEANGDFTGSLKVRFNFSTFFSFLHFQFLLHGCWFGWVDILKSDASF